MAHSRNALEFLRHEHREVQALFKRFENESGQAQGESCGEIAQALKARIEEEVFYPCLRGVSNRADPIEEADAEHDVAKYLISELGSTPRMNLAECRNALACVSKLSFKSYIHPV